MSGDSMGALISDLGELVGFKAMAGAYQLKTQ